MKTRHLNQLVQGLADYYGEQLAKYEEMHKLAQIQAEAIEQMDLEKIQGILARRQEIISEIDKINTSLLQVKEEIKQILHLKELNLTNIQTVHSPAEKSLKETLSKLEELLRQITQRDTQNEKALVRKMQLNQEERLRLNNQMKAQKAYYAGTNPNEPGFFDQKK